MAITRSSNKVLIADSMSRKVEQVFQNHDIKYECITNYTPNELKENINNSTYLRNSKLNKRRGAEIVKAALESINIEEEIKDARSLVNNNSLTNLNLTKIQSLPVIEAPGKYAFFVDVTFEEFEHYLQS